ncbi:MAG TPA: hypothetical protein VFA98_06340 [Thermoanaerobaculia bacterium]|jgi:hypothetical protein|nr:hypothetical protein [Thermoanaerobaculia bacterium]
MSTNIKDVKMSDWQGRYGGSVDGWWAPEGEDDAVLKGILVNFIDKDRSDKLQSNSLVFELIEATEGCKNGGSTAMPGEKGDDKLHKAPKGCMIGVPEWKQLEGLWPRKAGHVVYITRSGKAQSLSGGRKMYPIKTQVSDAAVKKVDVYTEEGAGEGVQAGEQFHVS